MIDSMILQRYEWFHSSENFISVGHVCALGKQMWVLNENFSYLQHHYDCFFLLYRYRSAFDWTSNEIDLNWHIQKNWKPKIPTQVKKTFNESIFYNLKKKFQIKTGFRESFTKYVIHFAVIIKLNVQKIIIHDIAVITFKFVDDCY